MSMPGSEPESVQEKSSTPASRRPSFGPLRSVMRGSLAFGMTSLAVFGVWAYCGQWLYVNLGEVGFYVVCAVLFVGMSGFGLAKLVVRPGSLQRFHGWWAGAFAAYALVWTICWLRIGGRSAEWLGSFLGNVTMGVIFAAAFGALSQALRLTVVLVITNAAGYFLGGWLHSQTVAPLSMFLWGAAYGFLWGGGIGYALHLCQEATRDRSRSAADPVSPIPT
jgi:hypothetical protein